MKSARSRASGEENKSTRGGTGSRAMSSRAKLREEKLVNYSECR